MLNIVDLESAGDPVSRAPEAPGAYRLCHGIRVVHVEVARGRATLHPA